MSLDARLNGTDLFGEPIREAPSGPVAEMFGFSPFSVLDAKGGEWQKRKRAWLKTGIKSELGRLDGVETTVATDWMKRGSTESGGSVFDPVLCECIYRWFCPSGGQVVDPFAGGSVRGVVAGMMGLSYWGGELRSEQVYANREQATEIKPPVEPIWVCGDSIDTLSDAPPADLLFSCPPYGDLEVYSNNPRDLSSMDYHVFRAAYSRIILRAVSRMKNDTFACFVVGDFRDRRGFYRNFVSHTIQAFEESGARLYNEAILTTPLGSAILRCGRIFKAGRKFVKVHQNVLIFCKGDWRKAAKKLGDIEKY
jgi:hypothetical protein